MENKTIKVETISYKGGIKTSDGWYNASTKGRQNNPQEDLEKIRGKTVTLVFNDQGYYDEIITSGDMQGNDTLVKDETLQTIEEIQIDDVTTKDEAHTLEESFSNIFYSREATQIFSKLYKESDMEVKKLTKGNREFSYLSWAEAWAKLKEHYPLANYHVHTNTSGMPYFADHTGGFVKVSVRVEALTHVVLMPILDSRNQPLKPSAFDSFKINSSIQRALAKAIAMFGLGLKLYKGEDLTEEN